MEQYTEKQYDDDLTVVADEYNDSFQTDNIDLFEFPSYDESPIAKLKSLVLSIDWEITDDILRQFNEELLDLKDIWAGEKIYLVYVQALEKISKYIYQEKADSNPNAIKLLLTFYYNLEKIISSEDMPEEEKKQILLEDVKRFEKLKQQIGKAAKAERKKTDPAEDRVSEFEASGASAAKNFLFDLKAIVLGIDWEITEKDLGKLRDEVIRLEGVFSGSRPKLIFLQGIGSLGAYIRLKKSNAHADAFKLLHSFFAGLEKIGSTPLSLEEEKAILFPEVEKFNAFKAIVGSTISSESIQAERDEELSEDDEEFEEGGLSPAFSDLPEGETRGFQEEEEAASLGLPSTLNVASQIDMFFSEEPDTEQLHVDSAKISASLEKNTRDEFRDAAEAQLDSIFQTDSAEDGSSATLYVGQDAALRGVDVETEADDDSGEEDLPLEAGQLAPALAELGLENWKEIKVLDKTEKQAELAGDLETRLDDFFAEEMELAEDTPVLSLSEDEFADIGNESAKILVDEESSFKEQAVLPGVDVESEDDEASDEEVLMFAGGDPAPALSEEPITDFFREAETALENAAETLFVSDEPLPALSGSLREESAGAGLPSADSETEVALEDHLESFFALEEVDEKTSVESRQENFEQHLRSDELFVEPTGDIISQEISIAATQEEEQHQAVVESEPALAFLAEVQPTDSLFEQEVLGGEDDHGPESEAVQLISTPEEPEEVVFELVEEAEELFFSSTEEENLIESLKKDEGQVTEAEDLSLDFEPGAPSALPEGDSALKTGEIDLTGAFDQDAETDAEMYAATAFIAEPSLQDEDNEFLAVFEEVGEEAAVDDLPSPQVSEAVQAAQVITVEHGQVEISAPEQVSLLVDDIELTVGEEGSFEEDFILSPAEDLLSNLRACVSSIDIELNDSIIQGLYKEINGLRSRWISRPIEKSFLQLLSTITQHIDHYRYESSSEALGLLQSVMNSFTESLAGVDDLAAQETLLTETTKVLFWQQGMLNRQAVTRGVNLTFADPVRFQAGESINDEVISFVEDDSDKELTAVFENAEDEDKISEDGSIGRDSEEFLELPGVVHSFSDDIESDGLSAGISVSDELAFENEQDSYPASDERKSDEVVNAAGELLFSDLEADLAAERTGIASDVHEAAPFDQQLKSLIQSEFAMIRQEWQNDLAALRNELKENE